MTVRKKREGCRECDAAEECTGPIEYLPVTQPTSTDDDDEEEP